VKVSLHHSLKRAIAILRRVDLPKAVAEQVWAECWDNGREQGLAIRFSSVGAGGTVYVAECRNSDQTVVVFDDERVPYSNKPSELAWEHGRKYFNDGEEKLVAAYIRQLLVNQFKKQTA